MRAQAHQLLQKASELLVPIYALTNQFPKDEVVARINQLHAAAVGILLNLAEGLSYENDLDLQRFLGSSLKAARDTIEELQIAGRLHLCPQQEIEAIIGQAEEMARLLDGLTNKTTTNYGKNNLTGS